MHVEVDAGRRAGLIGTRALGQMPPIESPRRRNGDHTMRVSTVTDVEAVVTSTAWQAGIRLRRVDEGASADVVTSCGGGLCDLGSRRVAIMHVGHQLLEGKGAEADDEQKADETTKHRRR